MKFSLLKKADDYEVQQWLEKALDLTVYQKEKLRTNETIRFSPFYFYKRREKNKFSLWWRLTIVLLLVYIPVMWIVVLVKWLITGEQGLSRQFLDKFHYRWMERINM